MNSRSVKAGHVAAIPNEGNEPGTELVTRVSIPIDIADETSTAHEVNDGMPSNIDKHTESETIVPARLPVAEGDPQAGGECNTGGQRLKCCFLDRSNCSWYRIGRSISECITIEWQCPQANLEHP